MIYGDNGIFMKWTEWFYSNDQSSHLLPVALHADKRGGGGGDTVDQ